MKQLPLFLTAITCSILLSFTVIRPHTDTYKVDTDSSKLEWFAEKVSGKHNGTIKLSSGDFYNNHGNYSGSFVIDMNSIVNTDIESQEYRTKLENHLKSPDFFDAKAFPKATFVLSSVTPLPQPKDGLTHAVKGMLTIKDKSNEITFNSAIRMMGNMVFATGSAVVDRSKFDVKYGSKAFFEDIGDKMIYDEFTLKFSIVAAKQ